MKSFTVTPHEIATVPPGSPVFAGPPKALEPFKVQAENCDQAAVAARAWATQQRRVVRSLSHAPNDTVVLVVYPEKR